MGWLGKPNKANATQTGVRARHRGDSPHDEADRHLIQGVVMANAGRWDEALTLLRAAAELLAATTGAESLESARVLHNLANVHWMKGEFSRAIDLHRRSLEMRQRHLGSDHPDTLTWSRRLLPLLETAGALEEARELADDLAARADCWGPGSPPITITLGIRVAHARLRWNTPQGDASFRAARQLAETRPDPIPGSSSPAEALDWAEALEGLAALEEYWAVTHRDARTEARQEANAAGSSLNAAEPGAWTRRAYEVRRAIGLEDTDPRQLAALTRLVETARGQRRWSEVTEWGRRVVAVAQGTGVASSPALVPVIEALIAAEHAQGRPASARSLAWIHLKDRIAAQGSLDLQRLRAPSQLALCCWAAGDLESARDWFATLRDRLDATPTHDDPNRSNPVQAQPRPESHPGVDPWAHARVRTWSGLGRVAWELGDADTARDAFRHVVELQSQAGDPHDPDLLDALERLAWATLLDSDDDLGYLDATSSSPRRQPDPAVLFDRLIEGREARVKALSNEDGPRERDARRIAWAMALEGRIAAHLHRGERGRAESLAERLVELMSRGWGASGLATRFLLLRLARRFAEVGWFDQTRRWLNHLDGHSATGDSLLAILPALPALPRRAIGCEADRLTRQLARMEDPRDLSWVNDWRVAWKGAAREASWIRWRLSDQHHGQTLQWLKARAWIEDRHARLAHQPQPLDPASGADATATDAEEDRRLRDVERRAQRLIRDWRRSVGWPETPPTTNDLAAVLPDETVLVDLTRVESSTVGATDSDPHPASEPHLVAFVTRRESTDLEADDAPATSATIRVDLGPAAPLERLARRWLESLSEPILSPASFSTTTPPLERSSVSVGDHGGPLSLGDAPATLAQVGTGLVPWAATSLQLGHRDLGTVNAEDPNALGWALAVGLWAPLAGLVREAETVLVAPPDEAAAPWLVLPWADLPDPADPDRQPLGSRQTVVVVPSARRVASWSFRLDGTASFERRNRLADRGLDSQGQGLLTVAAPRPSLRALPPHAGGPDEATPNAPGSEFGPSLPIPHASLAHALQDRSCGLAAASPQAQAASSSAPAARLREQDGPTAAFDPRTLIRQLHYRPGSQAEAMMLAGAARKAGLEGPIVELRGRAAQREAILRALPGKRYVHLALPVVGVPWRTHGPDPASIPWSTEFEPNPGRPLVALVASGAADAAPDPLTGEPDPRSHLITADDLAACDLRGCELVVLSIWFPPHDARAVADGEAASDLIDALFRAGARRVLLASSASAHDATIGFLGRLADALWNRSLPVPQAVRHAQQSIDAPEGERGRRSRWTLLVNQPEGLAPAGPAPQRQTSLSRPPESASPSPRRGTAIVTATNIRARIEPPALSRPE